VATQFRTRSKFLAVWLGVRFVALHRSESGIADGFLLVNAPVNWQIDYVVVSPEARGRGIASALVTEALNQARRRSLRDAHREARVRSLYAGCGFTVLETREKPAHSR
jgi:ribosomal protein S18 acetylase RimI-like enzyme